MAHEYRYYRPGELLEFYTHFERQSSPPPPGQQPPLVHDFVPVQLDDTITFARDVPDIRRYPVNTPDGDTLGSVVGYLVDAIHDTVPYAYVQLTGDRIVVVPTSQLTIYAEQCLTTLEGGITALKAAPDAHYDFTDTTRADQDWSEYRRRQAA